MCWSKNVSITMFLIGSAFNVAVWRSIGHIDQIKVLLLTSQFILLMQLFDAIVWSNQPCSDPRANSANTHANAFQMGLNVLQPVVFFVLSWAYLKLKPSEKKAAACILIFYVLYILFSFARRLHIRCSEPALHDSHLRYYWWDDVKYYESGFVFFVALILLVLVLVQNKRYAILLAAYGVVAMAVSCYLYGASGPGVVGHMWCFYQVLLPIIVYVGYIISEIK